MNELIEAMRAIEKAMTHEWTPEQKDELQSIHDRINEFAGELLPNA